MKKILFIGSGKSYRGKFAEAYFNHIGKLECLFMLKTHGIGRYPSSRYPYAYNSGINLRKPTKKLNVASRTICETLMFHDDCYMHFHRNLKEEDFNHCDYVIAMNESEHKEYLEKHFPHHIDKIEYWNLPKERRLTDDLIKKIKIKATELYERATKRRKK